MHLGRRTLYLLVALLCAAGYVWMTFHMDQRLSAHVGSVCIFKKATTLPCPSCGATRSMKAILTGDFKAGFIWNPLGYLLLTALLVLPWWLVYDIATRRDSFHRLYARMEQVMMRPMVMWIFVALMALNWIWNIQKGV